MSKLWYIYALYHPITNREHYIGKTNDVLRRYKAHLSMGGGKSLKNSWIKKLLLQNLKPSIRIIEECNADKIDTQERYWIHHFVSKYGTLKNMTQGGTGGRTHSGTKSVCCSNGKIYGSMKEAALALGISRSLVTMVIKNKNLSAVGHTFWLQGTVKPEPRKRITRAKLVYCSNGKLYKSIRLASIDTNIDAKLISAVACKKLYTSHGLTFWFEGNKPRTKIWYGKEVLCVSTGELFISAKVAARAKNIDFRNLSAQLNNKQKTVGGLVFKYT